MTKYRGSGTGPRSLIPFATMRLVSPASTFLAVGSLAWGCAVYDSGLIPSNSELTDGGSSMTSGGTQSGGSSSAGTFANTSGKSTSGGMIGSSGESTTAGSGVIPGEGGAGNEGGESPGGTSGSGGAGGKGGSGGSAGKGGTAGGGGTGGSTPVAKCSDHSITVKSTWVATASSESLGNGMESDGLYNPAFHMTDGNYNERWSSKQTQDGTEWIQIDFKQIVNLTTVTLNVNNDTGDYPRAYVVRLTVQPDPMFKGTVIASGDGAPGNTVITFPMATGQYLTVRQTGVNTTTTAWWTIAEVLAGCTDK